MSNKTIHFNGTINTVQPYASATPAMANSVKKTEATPVTRMLRDGNMVLAILSSGIKGALRRAAADVGFLYQQTLTGEEKPLSLGEHKLNRIGGVKNKGDSDRVTPDDLEKINRSQLIIALFGAGQPFIAGNLSVETAYASHNNGFSVDGVRSDDFLRNPDLLSVLDEDSLAEFLATTESVGEASKLKKERDVLIKELYKAKDSGEKEKVNKKVKAIDTKLEGFKNVSTQLPLSGYETIPAGESLNHIMRLSQKDGDLLQLGFLLEVLDYFAFNPHMGAKRSNGCGEVALRYDVTLTGYGCEKEELGSVEVIPHQGIVVTGDYLISAREDYKNAVEAKQFNFGQIV
jgi:hypothetical protein